MLGSVFLKSNQMFTKKAKKRSNSQKPKANLAALYIRARKFKHSKFKILRYSTLLYATLRYSTLLYATLRLCSIKHTLRYSTLLYATLRYRYSTLL
jgi:hypothetical protein